MSYQPVKSLGKALSIIECFNSEKYELSLNDITRQLLIPKPTVSRIISTLTHGGWLERDGKSGYYHIGTKLYIHGNLFLLSSNIYSVVSPIMSLVHELTDEAVSLSIYRNGYVTIILFVESKHSLRWSSKIGAILPAYTSAMGRSFLSEMSDEKIDQIYASDTFEKRTPYTITTKSELKAELAKVRELHISIDREGTSMGVEGIAYIIRDSQGSASAALGVGAPVSRMNDYTRKKMIELVQASTELASYQLGYHHPNIKVHNTNKILSIWKKG